MALPHSISTRDSIKQAYTQKTRRLYLLLAACIAVTILAVIIAVCIGSADLTPLEVGSSILSFLFPHAHPIADEVKFNIVWELRLPRIILADERSARLVRDTLHSSAINQPNMK